jgi:hypothetical protein
VSEDLKKELRYYLRVLVTVALALLAAKFGIKIEPPPTTILVETAPGSPPAKVTVVNPK